MGRKRSDAIDQQVGVRVRMQRLMLEMSQQRLAAELGVSFQQVQNYEKGRSRIGAGRLQQLARILRVSVNFFFEDFHVPGRNQALLPSYISDFVASADGLSLTEAFMRIRDARQRRCIVVLVKAMARR
jgi:transcriptional regulator with XRE-family HTH domain